AKEDQHWTDDFFGFWVDSSGYQKGKERHYQKDKGEQAVPELDDSVKAHLRRRYQGLIGALGPGRTTQTRGGKSDRAAGDHDKNLSNQRQVGIELDSGRGNDPVEPEFAK
ncbi:MAG: hypothetical protein RIQ37_375, partial [Actinomycetota bacterium]